MPMRSGTSPRARMRNGEATCSRPTAAPALSSERRSGRRSRWVFVIDSSHEISFVASIVPHLDAGSWNPPGAPLAEQRLRQGMLLLNANSARPVHRAAGFLDRTRGLFARNGVLDREHVVRVALGLARLPGEHRAH